MSEHKRRSRRLGTGPTVTDVARAAGVSPMTVSRVVNREGNVLPATREKVQQAVALLGYVPNAAARSLAGRPHCRLALLHSNPSASYLSEFLVGSLAGAAEADAEIVVEHWNGKDTPEALVARLGLHRIDAVLLPPPLCEDAGLLAALDAAPLPHAQIATGAPSPTATAVTIDDEAAAHTMTAHLLARGHTRIGFIAGNPNQTASALRRKGHEAALAAAGIAADPALIVPGDFTWRSGFLAAEALLSLPNPPTAIFASNDDMAAAALAAAHRHHRNVPGDLTVVGFDDSAMASTVWPEITTIRQPIAEMARRATLALTDSLRSGARGKAHPPRHEQLAFELIQRGSDGPPARNG